MNDDVRISRAHFNRLCQLAAKHKYGRCDCFDAEAAPAPTAYADDVRMIIAPWLGIAHIRGTFEEWCAAVDRVFGVSKTFQAALAAKQAEIDVLTPKRSCGLCGKVNNCDCQI